MDYTENMTKYIGNFVDELASSGVQHVVISPGSRSTPLAILFTEHKKINEWVVVDERSAAYFALGIAKQQQSPVAIVCTSGTAAANYYPALVEATYSRVPLIVLTADRPHELRDTGASQTIKQTEMYGNYAKWFHDMALPEATTEMIHYARSKASRAVYESTTGNFGPVHLNFPLREPLIPDLSLENIWGNSKREIAFHPVTQGEKRLNEQQIAHLLKTIQNKKKGVIITGPQVDGSVAEAIANLAEAWDLPILADPLSQLRAGDHNKKNIVECYDAFLRNKQIRETLKPEFIIRFGAMPVSKSILFYINELVDIPQYVVETEAGTRNPIYHATTFIYANPHLLSNDLIKHSKNKKIVDHHWLQKWLRMNSIAKKYIIENDSNTLTEGQAVHCLLSVIPNESVLYIGNSMPIRDVDTFFMTTKRKITTFANRGASGIDGVVSSSIGVAVTSDKPVTLVLGDLSFYHDVNGLLITKQYDVSITILLINNNGGGIFSFLPQAENKKHFEKLFGTPLHIDFAHAVNMYGGNYRHVRTKSELKDELHRSYKQKGLNVIEIQTNRDENVKWHRHIWGEIEKELLENG